MIGNNNRGTIELSFWDVEKSGQSNMCGRQGSQASGCDDGNGKTTAELKDPNTFIGAGWDFVGEFENGPSDDWAIPNNGGYPILWWELDPLPPLPEFSGGTGEPNDPYLLSTTSGLNRIGHNPRLMDKHFELIADLDLQQQKFYIIGNRIYPFIGVFNGNGHKISNFSFTSKNKDEIGLFGFVGGAIINGVGLENVYIDVLPLGDYVGGLIGLNRGGIITNCYMIGNITGYLRVGGLVGESGGSISNCFSAGTVSGPDDWIGGLVGDNGGTIKNCSSLSNVAGGKWRVGGLVGANYGKISECYAAGNVEGKRRIGGLAGGNHEDIYNCHSSSSVMGNNEVGGLVGYNISLSREISNCYSIGSVTGNNFVGGLVGRKRSGIVSNSFWDVNTSGEPNSDGGTGLTTPEMQDANTFISAGWDFNTPIWKFCSVPDYPSLWWECPALEPDELIAELLEEVAGLGLTGGIENSLMAKLNATLAALGDENENNDAAAINSLEAFINVVEAQRGKKIPEEDADALIAAAQQIIDTLSDR